MQMRVFRTILGMLLLTIGLPALLVGAGLWTTMQHRDAGGAFSATLQNVATPGYAVVVDDLDALLETDAPFVRAGDTRLRLTVRTASGPAFIGIAPAGEAERYLRGVSHAGVDGIDIGTGTLPVRSTREVGTRAPVTVPNQQGFWRASDTGQLDWNPSELRGGAWTLVVMNADAQPGIRLQTTAEVRPAWLNSAAWALLVSGTILIIVGMMVLAWPSRRREVFFVVEPSQVPELAKRMGAPLAIGSGPAGHTGSHRPRTLADANTAGTTWPRLNPPPALPQLTWPPAQTGPDTADAPAPAAAPAAPAPSASASSDVADAKAAGALDATNALAGPVPGAVSPDAVSPDATAGPLIGGRPLGERASRRRSTDQPVGERQVFEASAVEAWVAETAAARARDVDARAAAILQTESGLTAAAGLPPEIEDDEDDTPTGTPTGAIKPVKRTAPSPAAPVSAAPLPATAVPAPSVPAPSVPAGSVSAGSVPAPAGSSASVPVPAASAASAASGPAGPGSHPGSAGPAPAKSSRPGTVMDKPFEATLTKAAVSRAGLSRTTPVFLADDDPAADGPAPLDRPTSLDGSAPRSPAPRRGSGPSVTPSPATPAAAGDSAAPAPADGKAAGATADDGVGSSGESASAGDATVTGEGAGVPASRVPVGERRRSRRLTEDLAAAAEAALAGRSALTQADAPAAETGSAGSDDAASAKVEPAKLKAEAGESERGDAAVPVARTSSDQDPAELQSATATATVTGGSATGGRGRRKAADGSADSGGKAARATRRSAQSRPQSKG
jgi:hypothetical protein